MDGEAVWASVGQYKDLPRQSQSKKPVGTQHIGACQGYRLNVVR